MPNQKIVVIRKKSRDIVVNFGAAIQRDHGALSGLSDDDHPQYLNNARGDVRYARALQRETLTGTINGINLIFTTSVPFVAGSTIVTINSLEQVLGVGYTETPLTGTITFSEAPLATGFTDVLRIKFLPA